MNEHRIIRTKNLSEIQKQDILKLWNEEYPEQIRHKDLNSLENYLNNVKTDWHAFILNTDDEIIGWYFQFERNEETWFAMIIGSKYQGKGLGTRLLNEAKKHALVLHGWAVDHDNYIKSNGSYYLSPLPFYLKSGFEPEKKIRLETDNLSTVKIVWKKQPPNSNHQND